MGKAGFILHGARGKVGNLVARKSESGTVLQEYVVPNNPRTNGQMRVRVAFGTVAKAGAALADLIGISFQGETSIKGARRKFSSLNISKLTNQVKHNIADGTFAPKGYSVLIPNKYIVSDGTIRNATLGNAQVVGGDSIQHTTFSFNVTAGATYSATEILKLIFGVEPGDQITLVGIRSGIPVNYYENDLQILRDGQMVSARVFFKDATELESVSDVTIAADATTTQVATALANCVAGCIKEGYAPLVALLSSTDFFYVNEPVDSVYQVDQDFETAVGDPSPLSIFGNQSNIMAYGYFRSHLNSAGTQWMFSRCTLVCIDPEYTSETYDGEEPINYGCDFELALNSFLNNGVRENTRYTETGGSDNTLGF